MPGRKYVTNPRTGRPVLARGRIGKRILVAPRFSFAQDSHAPSLNSSEGQEYLARLLGQVTISDQELNIPKHLLIVVDDETFSPRSETNRYAYDLASRVESQLRLASFYFANDPRAPRGAGHAILCTCLRVLLTLHKIYPDYFIVLEADHSTTAPGREPGGLRRYYESLGFRWLQVHRPEGDEGGLMGATVAQIIDRCKNA